MTVLAVAEFLRETLPMGMSATPARRRSLTSVGFLTRLYFFPRRLQWSQSTRASPLA